MMQIFKSFPLVKNRDCLVKFKELRLAVVARNCC